MFVAGPRPVRRGDARELPLHLHRELPPAYLEWRQPDDDLGRRPSGAAERCWNSAQIAFAAMVLNLLLGAPAAFVYARYTFPARG